MANLFFTFISQPQRGRCHRAGSGQATVEVIGSKWRYELPSQTTMMMMMLSPIRQQKLLNIFFICIKFLQIKLQN